MKRYSRKLFRGLKGVLPYFVNVGDARLSVLLEAAAFQESDLFLCGSLAEMTEHYVREPLLSAGWSFARPYIHKFRSPFFEKDGRTVSVKLVGDSWLPGCLSAQAALSAWPELEGKYNRATSLPLLSTPSKTGQALLWKHLPDGLGEVELDSETSDRVRSISPQHRLEVFPRPAGSYAKYDGRWMYAGLCYLDRLPVGQPFGASQCIPYRPGWYRCSITIPPSWSHVGLIPVKVTLDGSHTWTYPCEPGFRFEEWVSEPEIAVALKAGWRIRVIEGFQFSAGRPLCEWQKVLVGLRESMKDDFAAAAIRQVLNHTIGALHRNDVEREIEVDTERWSALDKTAVVSWRRLDFDRRRVVIRVPYSDKLSIYMPHWSAQIYALERARIANHLLSLPFFSIAEVRGDAIYIAPGERDHSSYPMILDNGRLGQLRYQGFEDLKEVC